MKAAVTMEGGEDQVRIARQVLAGRGVRVIAGADEPPDHRSLVRVRRVQTTAFDGYEVVVVRQAGARKTWGALASAAVGGSEALLAMSLLEYLEVFIDPAPSGWRVEPRRRRRHRFARTG